MDRPADEDFAAFVRARTGALLRSAFLLTGDQHLAEDLVQSALTRTHRAWRRLHDRAVGPPKATAFIGIGLIAVTAGPARVVNALHVSCTASVYS